MGCSSDQSGLHTPTLSYTTVVVSPSETSTPVIVATSTRVPTSTPKPTHAPTYTPTITPTLDFFLYKDVWNTYVNKMYGFSFEYPAIYDQALYTQCRVRASQFDNGVRFDVAWRIFVEVFPSNGRSASQWVDEWLGHYETVEIFTRDAIFVNEEKVLFIEYQFGMLGRYGAIYIFQKDDLFYAVNYYTGGSPCKVPEIGINDDFDIYPHIVQSFKFIRYHLGRLTPPAADSFAALAAANATRWAVLDGPVQIKNIPS